MGGRRGVTLAVVLCAAASALVLLAAARVWGEVTTVRPAPLPPTVARRTGASFAPWLPALGIVGLAGAGALVATRGAVRTVLGCVLTACGLGTVAVALVPLGRGAGPLWPIGCAVAGLAVGATGVAAIRWGRTWPASGARFERGPVKTPVNERKPASQAELWDALDRGEDPTERD
jgi:hypothetical protein